VRTDSRDRATSPQIIMSSSSDHAHRPDLQPKESAAGHRMEGSQVAPAPAGPEPVPGEAKTLKSKVLDTGRYDADDD
jgi:hypothetical protein